MIKEVGYGVGFFECFKNPKTGEIYSILAKTIIFIYLYIVITKMGYKCLLSVEIFENDLVFLQVDTDSDLGDPILLGCIVPNTVYYQFQEKPMWVYDKHVQLDDIGI